MSGTVEAKRAARCQSGRLDWLRIECVTEEPLPRRDASLESYHQVVFLPLEAGLGAESKSLRGSKRMTDMFPLAGVLNTRDIHCQLAGPPSPRGGYGGSSMDNKQRVSHQHGHRAPVS